MKIFTFWIKKSLMYVHFSVSLPSYKSLILFTHAILHISKWNPRGAAEWRFRFISAHGWWWGSGLEYVKSMQCSSTDNWVTFQNCMQDSIRICGKHFALKNKQEVAWHQNTVASLRQVGNSRPLDDGEEETLAKCIQFLVDKDNADASKARFLSRCDALKDTDCVSKGFFKKLATKRQRYTLAKLQ